MISLKKRFYRFLKIYAEYKLLFLHNQVNFEITLKESWRLSNEKAD